jgi:hypothetical protein
MKWGDSLDIGFLGFRIFFIVFGFINIYLFYQLSSIFLHQQNLVYTSTIIFILLPAILTATIMANISIIVLSVVLLFIILYKRGYYYPLIPLMMILFFIHDASIVFFIAILIYSINFKKRELAIFSLTFILSFIILLRGIKIGGIPQGHFLDIFGLYATAFSPLLFIYFFYTMYHILLKEEKNILWYISFYAFIISLILSLRQRIHITDFAPYVIVSIILMVELFQNKIGVRLPEFQKRYKIGFNIVIFLLFSSFFITVEHRIFFLLDNPKFHFASNIYRPYYLSKELKKHNFNCYYSQNTREMYQLRYYHIYSYLDNGKNCF